MNKSGNRRNKKLIDSFVSLINRKFTLIELLMVISIISVLASILLPSLVQARDAAKTAVCVNNQKQVGIGLSLYQTDFDGALVPAGNQFVNILGKTEYLDAPKGDAFNNNTLDKPILTKMNSFYCPNGMSDRISTHAKSGQWNWINFEETLRPWRSANENYLGTKGGYDTWFTPVGVAKVSTNRGWQFSNWQISDVVNNPWPSIDRVIKTSRAAALHDGTHHLHSHSGDGSRIVGRHNNYKRTNVLFFDGHVLTASRTSVYAGRFKDGDSDHPIIFKGIKNN
ncbi:MAG: prepilin-type N-terminal cleavage/methylation domain-containing protein [Lentisphaeraceae bacterium]|nr:prepilin-type N-terminal cleavage/methylation domain-containing protein [Lentisphaeraceae bacterium]